MSLHLRLGLWYGGLTGIVVLLVSLLTYVAHTRGHYDDLDHTMAAAVEHVAQGYRVAVSATARAAAVAAVSPSVGLRVYSPRGEVVATSPSASAAPEIDAPLLARSPSVIPFDALAALAPAFIAAGHGAGTVPGTFQVAAGPDGARWRVYVQPLLTSTSDEYLVAFAPLDRLDASIDRLRRLISVFSVLGTLVSLGAGWLVAGRALRPVAAMTNTAHLIAQSRGFDRRVPVGADRDELGRLAATFNEMLASLEHAYDAQRRFVSDASHELRAPLTAIQANLDLLERLPDMPAGERASAIGEASQEARRLAQLVADLLALARADAGVPLRRDRVELDRVVMDAFGEVRHLARGQRLAVEHLDPVLVSGDASRLKQLLIILLDNAIKYTPVEGAISLGLRQNGSSAVLTVRDTGVGIPAGDVPHVFERFYRADPARARDPGGTGLGLAIGHWIVRQHRGEIRLDSVPGTGTTVSVRLPLTP